MQNGAQPAVTQFPEAFPRTGPGGFVFDAESAYITDAALCVFCDLCDFFRQMSSEESLRVLCALRGFFFSSSLSPRSIGRSPSSPYICTDCRQGRSSSDPASG